MLFEYYRRKFQEGDNAIFWGGETINRDWDNGTIYLYFSIVVFVYIIGSLIIKEQKRSFKGSKSYISTTYRSINYQLKFVFAVLLIFLGFRNKTVGIDTIVYRNTIENSSSLSQLFNESTTEPLYKLLQYAIHLIFNNGTIGILIYSFLTLYFIYKGLKFHEKKINLFISLIVYVSLYYFPSFNILRISLATSIVFYYFNFLIEKKYIKFAFVLLIVSLIHYSTLVIFLPYGIFLIYRRNKKVAILIACLLFITIMYGANILGSYLSLINRYSGYVDNMDSGGHIGIMLLVDYLPCILICIYIAKKKINIIWSDLTICFTFSALVIRLLAYYVVVAGRLHIHFIGLTMLLLPYWMMYLKKNNSSFYRPMLSLCILWAMFRLHIYFSGYLSVDGIMPYSFI